MSMTPNPTTDRLKFVAKQYAAKKPEVVMDIVDIAAHAVGADDWAEQLDAHTREADPRYVQDLETWYHSRLNPREGDVHATPELAETTVELIGYLRQFALRNRIDPLLPWMAVHLVRAFNSDEALRKSPVKLDQPRYRALVRTMKRSGAMMALWAERTKPNLTQMTFDEAHDEAEEWTETEGPVPQGEVVYTFADGWTAQKLTTKEQLDAEGHRMQHCVGSYYDEVKNNKTSIYSIRDPRGQPHVTIEVKNGRVVQTQGKQNKKPIPEYLKKADEFLESEKMSTERIPSHIRPYVEVIENDRNGHDVEDEHVVAIAEKWAEVVSSADEMKEWLDMGVGPYDYDQASALISENVTTTEAGQFPSIFWEKFSEDYSNYKKAERLIEMARMMVRLQALAEERGPRPESAQLALFESKATKRWKGQEPKKPLNTSTKPGGGYGGGHHDAGGFRFYLRGDDVEVWLDPAFDWIDADFSADDGDLNDVGPWFKNWFGSDQAAAWWGAGIEDGEQAAGLREYGVTPQMIEDLQEAGGEWKETHDWVWELPPREIVEALRDSNILRRNPSRRVLR